MILKVTINEGMGRIRCPFPSFSLDEEKNKSVLVLERSDQLKALEDEGIITISTITEAEYDKMVATRSKQLTARAIASKRASLNRLIKTGGKDRVITGSGLEMTVEPGEATPEEVSAEAKQELRDLNAKVAEVHPVDEIGEFLQQSGE